MPMASRSLKHDARGGAGVDSSPPPPPRNSDRARTDRSLSSACRAGVPSARARHRASLAQRSPARTRRRCRDDRARTDARPPARHRRGVDDDALHALTLRLIATIGNWAARASIASDSRDAARTAPSIGAAHASAAYRPPIRRLLGVDQHLGVPGGLQLMLGAADQPEIERVRDVRRRARRRLGTPEVSARAGDSARSAVHARSASIRSRVTALTRPGRSAPGTRSMRRRRCGPRCH